MACKEVPGFYGSFCNITCPSGSYGVDCAGDCTPTCLYYQCHHVYGCLKNITDQITTIASGSTKTHETINNTIFNAANDNQLTAGNIIVVTTEKHLTESKINSNYIFAGLGIVIVLLIFGILVHLWRKSKKLERKLVLQQTSRENDGTHDLSKQNQLMIQRDSTVQSCNTEHFYRPIATEYDEIGEDLEMLTLSEDYEIPKKLLKRSKTNFQTENLMIKINNQSPKSSENSLSLYLNPLFAPVLHVQNSSSPEERNLYLEVI